MKFFLTILLITMTFLGCSKNNAFDRFNLSHTQELTEESIQSSKLKTDTQTKGVVSTVYLNNVYPELYNENEYFYVYFFIKGESDIKNLHFLLNGSESIYIEELKAENEFSKLTTFDAKWKKYYLVGFKKQSDKIGFELKSSTLSSSTLYYEKDE